MHTLSQKRPARNCNFYKTAANTGTAPEQRGGATTTASGLALPRSGLVQLVIKLTGPVRVARAPVSLLRGAGQPSTGAGQSSTGAGQPIPPRRSAYHRVPVRRLR